MSTFYEKLSMRLQGDEAECGERKDQPAPKSVTYSATGDRTVPKKDEPPAIRPRPKLRRTGPTRSTSTFSSRMPEWYFYAGERYSRAMILK